MEYKDTTFKIGDNTWTAKIQDRIIRDGKYIKAARVPSKREIWLSRMSEDNKPFSTEEFTQTFQRAILPYVTKWAEDKYGKDKVEEALKQFKV